MKKLMIALSLAAAFSGSAFAEETLELDISIPEKQVNFDLVPVVDGKMVFDGMIYPETCSIKGGANQQINLPKIGSGSVKGTSFGDASFSISLENCATQDRSVTLELKPEEGSVTKQGNLKNTAKDGANVAIELANKGVKIDLTKKELDAGFTTLPHETVLAGEVIDSINLAGPSVTTYTFSTKYVIEEGTKLVPGKIQATLPFTIVYK
ncbi:fimbrial protein [Bisgaard Taxon 46]